MKVSDVNWLLVKKPSVASMETGSEMITDGRSTITWQRQTYLK